MADLQLTAGGEGEGGGGGGGGGNWGGRGGGGGGGWQEAHALHLHQRPQSNDLQKLAHCATLESPARSGCAAHGSSRGASFASLALCFVFGGGGYGDGGGARLWVLGIERLARTTTGRDGERRSSPGEKFSPLWVDAPRAR